MYLTSDNYHAKIKVFINNDWVWRNISFVKTDVKYLEKHFADIKASAPILEKRFGTYYLRFAFEEQRDFFDYVYLSEKLSSLSGRKLHSKKNHVNSFLKK